MAKKQRAAAANDSGDVTEVDAQEGKAKAARRFDQRDWNYIAEYVIDEWNRRKRERGDREKQWKEIDRQIAMTPDLKFKLMPDGTIDRNKAWMAEMELPLQAQALEVLTADARRMMFPSTGPWFQAHSRLTDEYLGSADFAKLIHGDEAGVPTKLNQDNADKLVESFLLDQFRQYDLRTRVDRINAESFKYGIGVGRGRMESKTVWSDEAMGLVKTKKKIPTLVPCSIKNLYLDDPTSSMHTAQVLGPAHIAEDYMRYENLVMACMKGSAEPRDPDGGWMAKNIGGIVPNEQGFVTVLEMEGDIVVPRKTARSFVLRGAIVTVLIGGKDKGGNATSGVVRFRWRDSVESSYLLFPYHYEGSSDIYPAGPLLKGMPIQMMAVDALNRMMDSAALKNQPPVGYTKDDMVFGQAGGPAIYPGAQWPTVDPIQVHDKVGGDPGALAAIFAKALDFYAELTGVLPSRLGAQTVSHTTAYAKDAELQRGAVRTVDYVDQAGLGPMTRWLDMAYRMSRDAMGKNEKVSFFIPAYGGFVDVTKDMLPDAQFEWFGAGGPAEASQRAQMKLGALQLGLKMDQLAVQMGKPPTVNIPAAIRETLREGGWKDLDQITELAAEVQTSTPSPGLTAPPVNPGLATVALQSLSQAA